MSVKLSKGRHLLFLFAICLTNIVIMADYVVLPVANTFYELFPNHVASVNFIISGAGLFALVSSLLAPNAMRLIGKKATLSIACIVFTVSAVFGVSVVSLPYLIVARCLCGFSYGFVQVAAIDIVADYYVDENKRASFMGIYNAAMAGIGAVMGIVAGNLAVTGWQNAYRTFWAAIPMTILVILFVPKLQSAAAEAEESPETSSKTAMGPRFWIALSTFVVLNICYTPMLMLASVYVAENALGNEAVAGLAGSLGTVGSCICCLGFGFLYSKLKARTSLISFVVMTLGLLGMYLLPGKIAFLAICTVCGGAYGMLFSYVYAHIPGIVPPEGVSRAISLLTASSSLAAVGGTYAVTGLMNVVPGHTVTAVCLVLGLILCAATVVEFINTGKMKSAGT